MESQSLSSFVASTVPSVLENSDYEQQSRSTGDSNVNYDNEQFESEDEHEQDPVVTASASLNSSGSDKYRLDEFEDDLEAIATGDCEGVEQNSTEDNDYEYESFEESEPSEATTAVEVHKQNEKHGVASPESKGVQGGHELVPPLQQDVNPQLGIWCSKMIYELRRRAANSRLESSRTRVQKTDRVSDKIPASVLQNLIHRASTSRIPHHQRGTSWFRFRQKLRAPASLMQRAQTQLWLAKSSGGSDKSIPETYSTSTPIEAPTFCSVKRENLLGQLATMQLHETTKKWATPDSGGLSLGTLDFVQMAAAKQREVSFANNSTENSGGIMLHRVAMDARLQLKDSIALRRQADTLLGRAKIP